MKQSSCAICRQVAGKADVPGGRIEETHRWFVDHTTGALGLGTLVVKPKRHVVHVWELDAEESSELGPLLQRTAARVNELMEPDQIYVCLWSHSGAMASHIHFVVQPVTKEQRQRHGGGARVQVALFDADITPSAQDAADLANRARELMIESTDEAR